MRYWLMKSEPEDFSLEDLRTRPQHLEPWTGVRNYQARNFMRDDMQVGDKVFFYHSNATPPGIAGLAEIASESFPDPTAFDSRSKYFDPKADAKGTTWVAVNVKYVETFPRLLSLDEMRTIPNLGTMVALQRGSRLSIQPVTPNEFKIVTDWISKRPKDDLNAGAVSAGSKVATPRARAQAAAAPAKSAIKASAKTSVKQAAKASTKAPAKAPAKAKAAVKGSRTKATAPRGKRAS